MTNKPALAGANSYTFLKNPGMVVFKLVVPSNSITSCVLLRCSASKFPHPNIFVMPNEGVSVMSLTVPFSKY